MPINSTLKSLLTLDMLDFWQRVHEQEIKETMDDFIIWKKSTNQLNTDIDSIQKNQHQQLCQFISLEIVYKYQKIDDLHERYGIYKEIIKLKSVGLVTMR
jgi:hypothetical protein